MGFLQDVLSTVTLGLVPSSGQINANNANQNAQSIAQTQQQQYGQIYGAGQTPLNFANAQQPGGYQNFLNSTQNNPLLQLYQTGQTSNPLLQAFGNSAGLNLGAATQAPGTLVPGATGTVMANGQPVNTGNTPAMGNSTTAGVSGQQSNPYNLTPAQQTQLNSQVSQISQQQQSAVSEYQQQMATQGITGEAAAAGEQLLAQHYNALQDTATANFAEQARANQEAALGQLLTAGNTQANVNTQNQLSNLNYLTGQQDTGLQTMLNATSGLSNPAGIQQNVANSYQQQANNQASGFGSVIGAVLGGGFSGLGGGGGNGIASGLGGMASGAPAGGYGAGYDSSGFPIVSGG